MRLYTTETITIPVRDARTLDVLVIRHDNHEKQPLPAEEDPKDPAAEAEKIPGQAPILHEKPADRSVGVLWLHGGGYATGSARLVMMSAGLELARHYNVTLFVPNYRLSGKAPYPAALHDAYDTLLYMKQNSRALDIRRSQLMVGGESAGGGLASALCLYARDRKEVAIAYQMPLYPMLDDRDTETNRDNSGVFWNSRRNRSAWKMYLKPLYPEKIIVGHPYNPSYLLPLIEICGPHAAQETLDKACEVYKAMGKEPVICKKEVTGFIVNSLSWGVMDDGIQKVLDGVCEVED
ncbi:MAG: alpha/beta hydrolase fold domain-containing protein, partial [Firmicutes bacterium]|nr:alpha/beta hydrolase fold domain-containing protein [Bacillota bacterium]